MPDPRATHRKVLAFALGLPGASEDHPWNETVAKVNKKVFVFLGTEEETANLGMTVKLDESLEQALLASGAHPSGYGLGKAGWVTLPFRRGTPPLPILLDWVEESYRRIAPRKLVAELDLRPARR